MSSSEISEELAAEELINDHPVELDLGDSDEEDASGEEAFNRFIKNLEDQVERAREKKGK